MKQNHWINLLLTLWQAFEGGALAYGLTLLHIPSVVIIGALIGFFQMQTRADTTKLSNEIFDLKEFINKKLN